MKQNLDNIQAVYSVFEIDEQEVDEEYARGYIKQVYTGIRTVPQLFLDGEFLGQSDVISEKAWNGELKEFLGMVEDKKKVGVVQGKINEVSGNEVSGNEILEAGEMRLFEDQIIELIISETTDSMNQPPIPKLAVIHENIDILDVYSVSNGPSFTLTGTIKLPYLARLPKIEFNPSYNKLEIFGDLFDHKNKEHGWIDLDDFGYTRSSFDRFEGREHFAAVYTPKLGMLIIGGNKNKEKWGKPLEYMSTCVLQVAMPKDSYKDWKYMQNIETGRIHPAAVNSYDKVYVSGGVDRTWKPIQTLEMLDLTDYSLGDDEVPSWSSLEPLNTPASRMNLLIHNNMLYSTGWYRDFPYSVTGEQYPFANSYALETPETQNSAQNFPKIDEKFNEFEGLKGYHAGGVTFFHDGDMVVMGGQETKFGAFSLEILAEGGEFFDRVERVPDGFVDRSGKGADLTFNYFLY